MCPIALIAFKVWPNRQFIRNDSLLLYYYINERHYNMLLICFLMSALNEIKEKWPHITFTATFSSHRSHSNPLQFSQTRPDKQPFG